MHIILLSNSSCHVRNVLMLCDWTFQPRETPQPLWTSFTVTFSYTFLFLQVAPQRLPRRYSSCSTVFLDESTLDQPNGRKMIQWWVQRCYTGQSDRSLTAKSLLACWLTTAMGLTSILLSLRHWVNEKILILKDFMWSLTFVLISD